MLYRLSISEQCDQFLLKGALLFDLWFDVPHRPTHDADFLGFGSSEIPSVEEVFRDICRIEVEDGIVFQPDSVKADEIRKEANYAGVRVMLMGLLGGARCPVQIDIGFGDAVVPSPENAYYPVILANSSSNCDRGRRQIEEYLVGSFVAQSFSWSMVQALLDALDFCGREGAQASPFGYVLADQTVGVFIP